MSEELEKVARAINTELVRQELSGDHDETDADLMLARAALLALREPTEGMMEAGGRSIEHIEECQGLYAQAPSLAADAFTAMVDWVLRDE